MNHNYNRNIFIIGSKESYDFINENIDNILHNFNLKNSNVIMPFEFENRDFINLNIDYNSRSFLIESDEYVKSLDDFNSLSTGQIQDLRIVESKKRAYKHWLNEKLNYSRKQIPLADICIYIHNNDVNCTIEKELKIELNIAKQLNKGIINIDQEKMLSLTEKIMILKQKKNK